MKLLFVVCSCKPHIHEINLPSPKESKLECLTLNSAMKCNINSIGTSVGIYYSSLLLEYNKKP